MTISKRLKTIACMVDTQYVYDIGCDHAYLDIYLSKNRNIFCIAIDKVENIVNQALYNIKKEGLEDKIKVILNDGLDGLTIMPSATVIISGLGTNTILRIISNYNIESLIIQSNDDIPLLRNKLIEKGYYITDEKIIYDNKFYIIIKFKKGKKKYSDFELFLGPLLLKEKCQTFVTYLGVRLDYFSNLLKDIPLNKFLSRLIVIKKIMYIKKALK